MTEVIDAAARVNGVPLQMPGEALDDATLRQRACTELLRQAAVEAGFDDSAGDGPLPSRPAPPRGAASEASVGARPSAADAIEALLERELNLPEPAEEACRRHFDADPARWGRGDRLHLRHVLFAVTPGVDVAALRKRAEALLLELRCAEPGSPAFGTAARKWSNCPSAEHDGDLGWLTRADVAPEFSRQVFVQQTVGVLPLLVHSRHGLHVVEVLAREPGAAPSFDAVRGAVALALRQQAWVNALRQYLKLLAGRAVLEGVSLDAADTPLVQ
jgi:peptidyl-prolyl cis-trans isomerase C